MPEGGEGNVEQQIASQRRSKPSKAAPKTSASARNASSSGERRTSPTPARSVAVRSPRAACHDARTDARTGASGSTGCVAGIARGKLATRPSEGALGHRDDQIRGEGQMRDAREEHRQPQVDGGERDADDDSARGYELADLRRAREGVGQLPLVDLAGKPGLAGAIFAALAHAADHSATRMAAKSGTEPVTRQPIPTRIVPAITTKRRL